MIEYINVAKFRIYGDIEKNKKFDFGNIYLTKLVDRDCMLIYDFWEFVSESLRKHITGDWGDTCEEDAALNEEALKNGERLFSVYNQKDKDGKVIKTIWIITETVTTEGEIATTILFPGEY